jgi:methyltransferase (TIGR00027 family)
LHNLLYEDTIRAPSGRSYFNFLPHYSYYFPDNYCLIFRAFGTTIYMMKENQSSITASGIAVARAVESGKPVGVRICYDPYAVKFINPLFYRFMRLFIDTGYAEAAGKGVMGFLVARCRYMDDLLSEIFEVGLKQLVVLGAGYDSRAYRFSYLNQAVKVFEVDHPATQQIKMKKVRAALGDLPEHVTYVGIDFNKDTLEQRLPECGYDEHVKTLFIWEGMVMYLSADAVDRTLGFIVQHSGPGSQVVFDYIYTALLDGTVRHGEVSRMHRAQRFSGEGLTFAIPEGGIRGILEQRGFTNVIDITSDELHTRYFTGPNAKRKVAWGYGIALAEVR